MSKAVLWIAFVALVGGALLLFFIDAQKSAYNRGYAAAEGEFKDSQIDQLNALISSARDLAQEANKASQALGKTISDRKQADAKTTKEIRDALAATGSRRVGCVFDAGVMQQLTTARERAAEAAASGIRGAVSAPR